MKKLLLFLIISAVAVFTAAGLMAKGGGHGDCGGCPGYCGEGPGFGGGPVFGKHSQMKKELGITEAQEKQMFDIGTKYRQLFFDNRNNPEKLKALREEKRKEMDLVLTKEQLEKIKKFHDKRGHHRHMDKEGRGHGHHGGHHPDFDGPDHEGPGPEKDGEGK